MRTKLWTTVVFALCIAVIFTACTEKKQEEPDYTVGGVMGDVIIAPSSADADISGKKVSELQSDITFKQTTYADVYEVSGKLDYQHNFTAYSDDGVLKNGFYLTFDLCLPAKTDASAAVVTVQSDGGEKRTFTGADFSGEKLTVTERLISYDGESYENISVTFDLDGEGTEYFAERYTLDLTDIDATLKVFAFGEWPMGNYYQQDILREYIQNGQKLVTQVDYAGLEVQSVASTIDMYELFQNPANKDDYTFSSLGTAQKAQTLLEENAYDLMFLQSGRSYTLTSSDRHSENMISAVKLCQLAAKNNEDVYTLIVAPHGIQANFDLLSESIYGPVENHSKHIEQINREVDETVAAIVESKLLKSGNVKAVYVGNVFEAYSTDAETVRDDLFSSGDALTTLGTKRNKPSLAGVYLTAATLYAGAFDTSPVGVKAYGTTFANLDCSIFGEDEAFGSLLKKYGLTAEQMALKLQTAAYTALGGSLSGESSYTVTFTTFGGSETAPITAALGTTLTAPAEPTRAGYVFKGWFKDKDLLQPFTFNYDTMPLGGLNLYARWEKAGETSYIVEHYVQGADGKYTLYKTDSDRVGVAGNVVYGTLLGHDGYVYNPTHASGRASAIVSADGLAKIKLYYDRVSFTVSYEYGEGYTNAPALPESVTVKYGDTVKLAADLSMSGKTFVGWSSGDAAVGDKSFVMPANDVVLKGYFFDTESCPTVSVASGSVYGKEVSSLQENIKISGLSVTGNLNYITGYTGYMEQQDTGVMQLTEYAEYRFAHGNYIALSFKWPAAATADAVISFVSGTDARTFKKSDGDFTASFRVNEYADNIGFTVDLDGAGTKYEEQAYQLELSGVTVDRMPGFEEMLATARAYDARGDQLQYETYSMGKTSTGSGFGEMRHDTYGVAEIGTWQYILHLDCSSWIDAVYSNAFNYNFGGMNQCTKKANVKAVQVYSYEPTNRERPAVKEKILDDVRSILQPGDIVMYLYGNEGSGHIMQYIGDNTLMHCAGGSFRDGLRNYSMTGSPYDMNDEGGSIKLDSLDIIFDAGHSNSLFSTASPKYFFAILRPLMLEEAQLTEYGELHGTYPDLFIEKTTSHPQGYTVQVGDEVEFTISLTNMGAGDMVLTVENLIPEGTSIVKGNATEEIRLNGFDTKVVHVTYKIEQSVIDWMDETGYEYINFGTKVNNAAINSMDIRLGKMLTAEQEEKIQSVDLSTLTSTSDFDLMIEFYEKALGYDLTEKLEGCTDFDGILRKLFDAHLTSDYMTMNYDLSGSTGDLMSLNPRGVYGGIRVRSTGTEDHYYRIKCLTDYKFAIGDILIYSGSPASKAASFTEDAGMYIYLGNGKFLHYNDGIEIVQADGRTNMVLEYNGEKRYIADMLGEMMGAAVYVVLRPSQVME